VHAAADRAMGLALALGGSVAFSGKAIIVKLAFRHGADAVTLLMYRMVFALPFFLGLMWWAGRGQPPMAKRDRLAVWALGFSGYYLASNLDFLGLQYISASLERLILYLNPTIVLLLGWWLFGRRATRSQLVALAVSYCGVLLVFGREVQVEGQHVALGAALVLGSTLSYAAYMLHSGQVLQRMGSLRLTGAASSVACLICMAQFALLRPLSAAIVTAPVLWLSLLNAVACTVAPVLMVMMAIERVGPAVTSQAGMIGPIATILLSIWLLGEPFTPWLAAGTVCVMVGVGLMARGKR
jgi:drug/metabolite transporter (DMT)-like permease